MSYPMEQDHPFDETSDEAIRQQVCQALRDSQIPGEESIEVYVAKGVVVLEGDIEEKSSRQIEELVKGLNHVQGLISNLQPARLFSSNT